MVGGHPVSPRQGLGGGEETPPRRRRGKESREPVEQPIVSEALVEVPTKSKVLKTAKLEETSGMEEAEVGMAPP